MRLRGTLGDGLCLYLSDGTFEAMHIDGSDRDLVEVSNTKKGKSWDTHYTSGDYTIDMRWRVTEELEVGSTYDVKVRVVEGDRPPLQTTLSCSCGC